MDRPGAKVLATAVVGALVVSVTADLRGVHSVPLLVLSIAVAAYGIVGLFIARPDPMPTPAAWAVAATAPFACALICLAIPGPVVNPNQTNALGSSLIVLAFLCVRGRIVAAWSAMATMIAIFMLWASLTAQGPSSGLLYLAPSIALIGMATLFAVIVRPAAAEIHRLRKEYTDHAADAAASKARRDEGDHQQTLLHELAWPTLDAVARGEAFSVQRAAEVKLTEAQLRDSVRARSLATPGVIAAGRAARARGVEVIMFDDGAMDEGSAGVRERFCQLAAQWLASAVDGTITVRVHPPGRALLGSIVTVTGDGASRRVEMDVAGDVHAS
jgi:hypothetical protein